MCPAPGQVMPPVPALALMPLLPPLGREPPVPIPLVPPLALIPPTACPPLAMPPLPDRPAEPPGPTPAPSYTWPEPPLATAPPARPPVPPALSPAEPSTSAVGPSVALEHAAAVRSSTLAREKSGRSLIADSRCFLGVDAELDQHVVFDQIVRHTRVNDRKIFAIDAKFGVDRDLIGLDFDLGGEGDALGHAVQLEITTDGVGCAVLAACLDRRGSELGLRKFLGIEEVRRLQMPRELCWLDRERSDINLGVYVALSGVPADDVDGASERFERAVVLGADFRADEGHGRAVIAEGVADRAGCRSCRGHGFRGAGDGRLSLALGRVVVASPSQAAQSESEERTRDERR